MNDSKPPSPRIGLISRVTLVVVAAVCIWLGIRGLANAVFGPEYSRNSHVFRAVLTSAVVIPFLIFVCRYFDRRPLAGVGLGSIQTGWRPLAVGAGCYLIPATGGVMLAVLLDWTEITPRGSLSDMFLTVVGLSLLVFIYEALPEELIFRGYLYSNLAEEFPRWIAVLGQAVLFVLWGLLNGGPFPVERGVLFFSAAIVFGVFRVVTGSVWASIGFHLAFQTVAQFFGSVGNQLMISDPESLSTIALVAIPFATAIPLLYLFYRDRPNWRDPEGSIHLITR